MASTATPAEGDENLEFKKLLLGSAPSQMNLENLRKRAAELQSQLDRLAARIHTHAAGLAFEELLKDFAIINTQYIQLQFEIRGQLHYYVAHPLHLTDANRELVPDQLSTMALPEMSVLEAQLLQTYPKPQQGAVAAEEALRRLQDIPQLHNDTINHLFAANACLHEKSALRKAIAQRSAGIQKEIGGRIRSAASKGGDKGKGEKKLKDMPFPDLLRAFKQGKF